MEPAYPNPPGRAIAALALLAGLSGFPALSRAEDAAPAVTGAAAASRIIGNTLSGTTPDGPFLEVLAPGGTLTIVDGDGKGTGTWRWQGDRLCTRVDGEEEEECRDVAVTGADGVFTDAAGSRYRFVVLPGNPKGL